MGRRPWKSPRHRRIPSTAKYVDHRRPRPHRPGSLVNKERDANYAQTADCTYFYQRSSVAYYLTTTRVNLRLCFAPEPQAEKREERRNTEWRDRWVFCPVHHPTRFPDPSYLAIVYHRGGCRALGRLHKISLPFCVTIYPVASALVAPEPARIFHPAQKIVWRHPEDRVQ